MSKITFFVCAFIAILFEYAQGYDRCYTEPNTGMGLFWKIENDNISFRVISAASEGWAAVGFNQKGEKMPNADIVMGFIKSGQSTVSDYKASSFDRPSLDAAQNIANASAVVEGGRLAVQFSRKLDTGDTQDWIITNTIMSAILAYSESVPVSAEQFMVHKAAKQSNFNFFSYSGHSVLNGQCVSNSYDVKLYAGSDMQCMTTPAQTLSNLNTTGCVDANNGVFARAFAEGETVQVCFFDDQLQCLSAFTLPQQGCTGYITLSNGGFCEAAAVSIGGNDYTVQLDKNPVQIPSQSSPKPGKSTSSSSATAGFLSFAIIAAVVAMSLF